MQSKRLFASWLVINFLVVMLFVSSDITFALAPQYETALKQNLWLIIWKHPKYTWGGAESEEKGIDCSGYLYLAAKRAGIPVRRTTAIQMESGLAGWTGKKVTLDDAGELDILWWTWPSSPHRKHGHVGFFLVNNRGSKLLEVTHSSSSKGVIIQQLRGSLLRDISSIKRLTIGDKQQNGNGTEK